MDLAKTIADKIKKLDEKMQEKRKERVAQGYGTLEGLKNAIAKKQSTTPPKDGDKYAK
jgi:hypothetical protein